MKTYFAPTAFLLLCIPLLIFGIGCASRPAMDMFHAGTEECYDRDSQSQNSIVDSHLHFRPFGGHALPFEEVVSYLERTGVLFVNIYGIGQMLPVSSDCTYYLDCPGVPVTPTLKNDFVNAANFVLRDSSGIHMTLSMTFPDLEDPDSVVAGIKLLDKEYPGMFRWMGEVNLVKQALFNNEHDHLTIAQLPAMKPFMDILLDRGMPMAVHSDLGDNEKPTNHLPIFQALLQHYPENKIVWMHMGLSKELTTMNPDDHIEIMRSLLDSYPNLMIDLSWRVIDDFYFSNPAKRAVYVPFLNEYSDRFLQGTDFVASANKNFKIYKEELRVTSRINQYLDDEAFRNIALGQNYFDLLKLDYEAPAVCSDDEGG